MENSAPGPEADKIRHREVTRWFAQAHDLLDEYGIPRFGEYTLPQRLEMLGEKGGLRRLPHDREKMSVPSHD